jgi:hypothetical protein
LAYAQLNVSMNLSLDGYIEAHGQDDGSWLRIDEAVHRAFAVNSHLSIVMMGRRWCAVVVAHDAPHVGSRAVQPVA